MHKPMINKKVSLFSQERHAAKTVSEMKHFVSKLPHLQQMRQSLSVRKYHQAFVWGKKKSKSSLFQGYWWLLGKGNGVLQSVVPFGKIQEPWYTSEFPWESHACAVMAEIEKACTGYRFPSYLWISNIMYDMSKNCWWLDDIY